MAIVFQAVLVTDLSPAPMPEPIASVSWTGANCRIVAWGTD
jgi:hypothetical protein